MHTPAAPGADLVESRRRHTISTIAGRFDPRDNALNALRLVLAVLVIVSHCRPVGGFGSDPRVGDLNLGQVAVGGFFTISGYLITSSRLRTPFLDYAWRRALRIMPGFWVCLLVTAFVAAPLTGLVRGGWSLQSAVAYVGRQFALYRAGSFSIGDTLVGVPYSTTWNASLWTLFYEAACYVIVGVALFSPWVRRHPTVALAAYVLSTAASVWSYGHGTPGTAGLLATFLPWFLAGAVLLGFAGRVPLTWWGAAAAAVLLVLAVAGDVVRFAGPLPVGYLCLWLGVAAPSWFRRVGSRNDVSYGMYLFGFPVQQSLYTFGVPHLGVIGYTLACIAVTVPIAWASWLLVERPALRWKSFLVRIQPPRGRMRASARPPEAEQVTAGPDRSIPARAPGRPAAGARRTR